MANNTLSLCTLQAWAFYVSVISMLIDTHCHIHEADFPLGKAETLAAAQAADVRKLICVGTNMQSSREAVYFAKKYSCHPEFISGSNNKEAAKSDTKSDWIPGQARNDALMQIFAAIGVHPHDSKEFSEQDLKDLRDLIRPSFASLSGESSQTSHMDSPNKLANDKGRVAAIGEIGLDYFYEFSPREKQIRALEMQMQLATDSNLPISFHVRDDHANSGAVWRDFWPILNNFPDIKGALHSFTDTIENLEKGLNRGLFIGVNGIVTFAKENELDMWRAIPLNRMLLETDAPFLSPVPFRGQKNQPSFIPKIVEFLSDLRSETFQEIAKQTTQNAENLFNI